MKAITTAMALMLISFTAHANAINSDFRGFPKWQRVMSNERFTPPAAPFAGDLNALIAAIHKKYASVPYVEDFKNFQKEDYWQTREDMKKQGSGDCEDFAIAEYYDLLEAGVNPSSLWIAVVIDNRRQQLHAVLIANDKILDQINSAPLNLSDFEKFYTPIFKINREGWTRGY